MIFFAKCLYSCDYCRCPLNDQVLETVLLIEISVHKLLHGLLGKAAFIALGIKLGLLVVDVIYQVFKLLESKGPLL